MSCQCRFCKQPSSLPSAGTQFGAARVVAWCHHQQQRESGITLLDHFLRLQLPFHDNSAPSSHHYTNALWRHHSCIPACGLQRQTGRKIIITELRWRSGQVCRGCSWPPCATDEARHGRELLLTACTAKNMVSNIFMTAPDTVPVGMTVPVVMHTSMSPCLARMHVHASFSQHSSADAAT